MQPEEWEMWHRKEGGQQCSPFYSRTLYTAPGVAFFMKKAFPKTRFSVWEVAERRFQFSQEMASVFHSHIGASTLKGEFCDVVDLNLS